LEKHEQDESDEPKHCQHYLLSQGSILKNISQTKFLFLNLA